MENQRASKKQQELLSFVDGFIKGNGFGPSYREIMRALGYKSVSTVAIHIDGLIAKGYLARRDKSARSLEVVTSRYDGADGQPTCTDGSEAVLITKLNAVDLTPEQRSATAEVFRLIGFESAALAVAQKEVDA